VPGQLSRRGLRNLEAAGQEVAVQPPRLGVGICAVRRAQVIAQLFVPRQRLRPPAHCRMPPNQAPNRTLVERVRSQGLLQRVERLGLVLGRASRVVRRGGGGVGEVDEKIAETLTEFLTRPGGPVFEPVLGKQIARIRSHRRA